MERRLAVILAADVVGYSRLMGDDEAGTLERLMAHRNTLVQPTVEAHGGRIFKLMGDGVFAEFASVVEAVTCAAEIQTGMTKRTAEDPADGRIQLRIGINLGDVIAEGDDIYGDGVNVAARVEALAPPGGICIARSVRDQIRDKLDYPLEDLGEVEVKNIARPVRVFRVVLEDQPLASVTPVTVPRGDVARGRMWQIAPALLVCLAIIGGVAWWQPWAQKPEEALPERMPLPQPDKPSIAVLPFSNLSDERTQEYFADGLTDDLITDLSKISGLFVIARHSAFTFKGGAVRIEEVAEKLGVHYVVEGSVRRSGDRVRVNVQLVDGATGHHLWAERYDRKITDLFAVQDDLVSRIVASLAVELTQTEETKLTQRPVPEFQAYDLYLQARDGYFSRDQERMRESLALYARAWEVDPTFARAYAGYAQLAADIWRLSFLREAMGGATARKAAVVAARRALALDPTLADAHSVLALMSMVDKNHEEAMEQAKQAVELDPNSAHAHTVLAIVLIYAGQPETALESIRTSVRLNPRPTPYQSIYYGLALFLNDKFDDAIAVLEPIADTRDRGMADAPREILAMAYAEAGRRQEARVQVAALREAELFLNVAYHRVVYEHHARKEDVERRLDALRKADMPTWPFDFQGKPEQRLAGSEIQELITAKTWSGRDAGRQSKFMA